MSIPDNTANQCKGKNSGDMAAESVVLRQALDNLNDAVMLFGAADPHGIFYLNQAARELMEPLGLAEPLSIQQCYPKPERLREVLAESVSHPYGEEIILGDDAYWLTISPIWHAHEPNMVACYLAQWMAWPPRRRGEQAHPVEQSLEYMAYHDALTGLPNRQLLYDRMTQAMASARRREMLLAVLFLDLDGFKAVNDNLGHAAGDELLKEVARRLKQEVRGEDTVARLGGDEFVVLLNEVAHVDDVTALLNRLTETVRAAVWPEGSKPMISASIGVTLFPLDDGDEETLLRHADLAMYQAKIHGRNQFQFFDINREQALLAKQELRERLARALHQGEFCLYYQPQVNMRSGEVFGIEALIRWQDPLRGLISPDEFIPVAEGSDLILGIGRWVLIEALSQTVRWREQGIILRIAVNVAARQFMAPGFVDDLRGMLAAYSIPFGQLELEITESTALRDMDAAQRIIAECRKLGVRFALDDFGTGYATLTYLKRLSADIVKIDQSFVRHMIDAADDVAIIEGVIAMANLTRRSVLAEGVETIAHGIMLLRLGCDLAQGYAIARPMPAAELPAWLAEWSVNPLWRGEVHAKWDIQDFPLLVAKHDHVLWVERVINAVHDPDMKLNMKEVTSYHQCGLGKWYDKEGKKRYSHLPAFRDLDAIHRKVHETGIRMLELKNAGDLEGAERLEEALLGYKTQVLEKLTLLHDSVEQ
jgi:diguanylate cyclase (GGDEF)-like protein